MKKTYILSEVAYGNTVYAASPPHQRKDGGKFVLGPDLTQQDLAYLYANGHNDKISCVDTPEKKSEPKKTDEKKSGNNKSE